ncbi:hypothetical protein SELMODRAFT_116660 [Selaginella moellendorffii]|uniref:SGNH hydrolase-type esterase domain-containing protein n=1 Tax=Selaginella moellendorffii TaxID=88036 RepID=D8SGR9_SELML|nr:hypothetical protein SELMODRAFT_116660 [Selaginella moellendorffii]
MNSSVPALFAFGDSLVDAGDNAHVGYPYGIDFPGGQASRFCNGRLLVEYIALHLGLPLPPAYFQAGNNILQGANFGSAGSGILSQTHTGGGQALASQIDDFRSLKQKMVQMIGSSNASTLVAKSIFYICSGNNDINNMYQRTRRISQSDEQTIINTFVNELQTLYNLGARKFVIVGLSAVGCIPLNVVGGQCASVAQQGAQIYNNMLQSALENLRNSHKDAQFVMTNFYGLMVDVHNNPQSYGFIDSTSACCPQGSHTLNCNSGARLCQDRTKYAFWDGIHQTDAFNSMAADRWWTGATSGDVSPISISELASS